MTCPMQSPEEEKVLREETIERAATQIDASARSLGEEIYALAAEQHSVKGKGLDWSKWSIASLEMTEPVSLANLRVDHPELVDTLLRPVGETQKNRDPFDDSATVSGVRIWNNPATSYLSIDVHLRGGGVPTEEDRYIKLEANVNPHGSSVGRTWETLRWVRDIESSHLDMETAEINKAGKASESVLTLAEQMITGGTCKAKFVTQEEKME